MPHLRDSSILRKVDLLSQRKLLPTNLNSLCLCHSNTYPLSFRSAAEESAFAFAFARHSGAARIPVFVFLFLSSRRDLLCPFVCHPAGICFCRCCCLQSMPPQIRHPERSAAESKDPETARTHPYRPNLSATKPPLLFCLRFCSCTTQNEKVTPHALSSHPCARPR